LVGNLSGEKDRWVSLQELDMRPILLEKVRFNCERRTNGKSRHNLNSREGKQGLLTGRDGTTGGRTRGHVDFKSNFALNKRKRGDRGISAGECEERSTFYNC